ncbi:MAG: hypothetical protein H6586_08475 [Flavobacteriales bacterium]|nr:hypothetical protein [Flavobacteriales bacterium]
MRKVVLPILTICSVQAFAQSIDMEVVSSTGTYMEQPNGSISSTMGSGNHNITAKVMLI